MPLFGEYPLNKIGFPEAEILKRKCLEKGLAPATTRQCLALLRATFNFAANMRLFNGINPVQGVKFPKLNNKRTRFLSHQEARLLLQTVASYDLDLYDMCNICLYTGMRAGEMATLKWHDIDFDHDLIIIGDSKNGESRHAYMRTDLRMILLRRAQNKSSQLVFPNKYGHKRERIRHQFRRLIDKTGLNEGFTDRRSRVCFHTLRHTFASWLALNGETLLTIKELLGHKTLAMTLRYAHLIPDQKRKAVERLGGL